jgi:ABA responsive element binding factor
MGNRIADNKNSLTPIFPKQAAVTFSNSNFAQANNGYLANPGTRDPIGRVGDASRNNGFVQTTVIQSGSPVSQLSSDGNGTGNVDTSSVSPSPYAFTGSARGRRSGGTLEKAMERRHRRMIKNRESAARSRARKQAYTLELEEEVAKLKEMNEELRRKQEEIMEMQKDQVLETMNKPWGSKRRCLRRTLTGPW